MRIGGLDTRGATWGAVFQALHGEPGETRTLTLERAGARLTVTARVTAF
jgi:C-terminal processing protease CtpA/Prc